jgi:hypothetical protein
MPSTTTVKRIIPTSGAPLPWHTAEELPLTSWPWNREEELPVVTARLLCSRDRIHAHFEVAEQHVLARALERQGEVWRDSCVELFLSVDGSTYINFEINCIGTYLCCRCRPGRRFDCSLPGLAATDFTIATSLPKGRAIPEPLPCPPGGYTVEFSIPFSFVGKVLEVEAPRLGTVWRANLYKCGDDLPHPHWGAWSEVRAEKPDFHRPEFFGQLVFQ